LTRSVSLAPTDPAADNGVGGLTRQLEAATPLRPTLALARSPAPGWLPGGLQRRTWNWGGVLLLALAAHICAYGLWAFFLWGGEDRREVINDLATLPVWLAAGVLTWRASTHAALPASARRAWRLLALANFVYWAGDVMWLYFEVWQQTQPFPSLADAGYLLYYPLALWGLVRFPAAARTRAERSRFWLDAGTVLLGGAIVVWYAVLRPIAAAAHESPLATVLSVAYPVGDLVLLLASAAVLMREPEAGSRRALALLAAGVALGAVTDLAYGVQQLDGSFASGGWLDVAWAAAAGLTAAAGQYQHWRAGRGVRGTPAVSGVPGAPGAAIPTAYPASRATGGRLAAVLPYAGVVAGYGLLLWVTRGLWNQPVGQLAIGGVALTALVLARQVAALREVRRLLEERAAARAMHQSETRFRSLVQHASDLIIVVHPDGTIRYQSPSVRRVLGHEPGALHGLSFAGLLHADDAPRAQAFLAGAIARHDGASTATVEWRMRDGGGIWHNLEAGASNLVDDPNVGGLVLTLRDVTARKRLEEQLTHQALHDPLTGLANRALFHNRVEHALARSPRPAGAVAVLFLDLDDFKAVNDSLGHAVGDALLAALARRVQACVRPSDTVARLGGDEFAVLIEDPGDGGDAQSVAARIAEALRAPFDLAVHEVFAGASIGIAVAPSGGGDGAEHLLRNADIAMYTAKSRGKGRCVVYEPAMQAATLERLALTADLRRALARDELAVVYQPITSLETGRVCGVEALVRWRHPQRGLLGPGVFIPIAEETGLVVPIGRWVLEQACRQARRWQTDYPDAAPQSVSVNLSVRQLQQPALVDDVARVLCETGLEPRMLTLELTETLFMQDTDVVVDRLHALKALGVRLAVDDFGTGYSSLSYLRRFPIDVLKIDRSFVEELGQAAAPAALVQTIINLAQALQLRTVAEGIEVAQQRDELRALGCDLGQGYLFAKPLTTPEMAALLQRTAQTPPRDRFASALESPRETVSV
jgi:diguanylate cyclase (GGDEF)-like protein/PAS domain S-box-containing protein